MMSLIGTNKRMTYKCEYCNREYRKESTLAVHMCPKKKRHIQKDEKYVQLGFRAYQLFYRIGTNSKKEKTYSQFVDSQYYGAFAKFGQYCIDLKIDDVQGYVEWLLSTQVKLDRWTSDVNFGEWIKSRLKHETAERAVERTIIFLNNWAEENNTEFNTYFETVNTNVFVFHICSGKISPWIIFASDKAQQVLEQMNEEQIGMIVDYIDPDHWQRVFKRNTEDFEWTQQILEQAGLK